MRIVFFGTPEFSLPSLEKLHQNYQIVAVFTQPDRPAGRGLKPQPSAVKKRAVELGLKIYQPEKLDERTGEIIQNLRAQLGVVVAYGKIIPSFIISAFPEGIINYHPSLLPKLRGAAPVQRAILSGEKITGGTVIYLTEEMDAGDILWQKELEIREDDDCGSLSQRLSLLGAEGLLEVVRQIEKGETKPVPQDSTKATYASKIEKEELRINWEDSAYQNWLKIRAFAPQPAAYCFYKQKKIKIYQAALGSGSGKPAEVILASPKSGLEVACKKGSLYLTKLKPEGGSLMSGAEFVRGYRLEKGNFLD